MTNNRLVLNVDVKYYTELIPQLDNSDYFRLSNQNCQRKELFNFALALGYKRGYPTELEKRVSLIRREVLANDKYLYMSVFFKEFIEGELCNIDKITDEGEVFSIIENYVNTGFSVLKDYMKDYKDEDVAFMLIKEMDEIYKDFEDDLQQNK